MGQVEAGAGLQGAPGRRAQVGVHGGGAAPARQARRAPARRRGRRPGSAAASAGSGPRWRPRRAGRPRRRPGRPARRATSVAQRRRRTGRRPGSAGRGRAGRPRRRSRPPASGRTRTPPAVRRGVGAPEAGDRQVGVGAVQDAGGRARVVAPRRVAQRVRAGRAGRRGSGPRSGRCAGSRAAARRPARRRRPGSEIATAPNASAEVALMPRAARSGATGTIRPAPRRRLGVRAVPVDQEPPGGGRGRPASGPPRRR